MNVIGDAYVRVHSLGDAFEKDVQESTAPGFSKLETESEESGALAGSNLRGGVKSGLQDVEKDAEESGGRAGSKLSTALNSSLGSSVEGGPLSKLAGLLGATGPIGLGAIAVGGALVGLGGFALKMGADMVDADAKISASAGISKEAATQIGDAFLTTGGKFTFSGIQMAGAYATVAAQLGNINGGALNSSQALDVMTASANLAEAAGIGLNSATKDVAQTLQTFKLPISDAAFAADNLYNVAKTTGQSVDTVSGSLQKLKTQLGPLSPDLATMSGMIADLAANGEGGRKSVGALAAGLTALITPTTAQATAAQFLGLHTKDANGNFVGMQSVINQLQPKLAGLTGAQQVQALTTLLGAKQAAAFAGVIDDGSKALDKHIEAMAKTGSAQDAASKTTDTFAGSMDKAKAGIVDIAAKIGEKAMPMIDKLAADLASVVQWVVAHWPEIENAISRTWSVIRPIFTDIGDMIRGAWMVVSGFIEFIVDIFQGHWSAAWGAVQRIFDGFVTFIKGRVGMLLAPFEMLGPTLAKIWGDIESAVQKALGDIVKFFSQLPGQILTVLQNIVATIMAPLLLAWTWINTNVIQPIIAGFTKLPSDILNVLLTIVSVIFAPLLAAAGWVNNNVISPVVSFFSGLPGRVVSGFGDIVGTIFGGLTGAAGWVDSNVIQPVARAFSALPGDIAGAIVAAFNGAVNIGEDIINWIKKGLNDAINWYNNHRPSLFGVSLLPAIPTFATGGYVTQPTIALIGEAGPEYVIPESQLRNPSGLQSVSFGSTGSSSGVGQLVQVTIEAGAVVITVPKGASTSEMQTAVNDGFVTLAREVSSGVAPTRSGSVT